jgi:hypothetical protein
VCAIATALVAALVLGPASLSSIAQFSPELALRLSPGHPTASIRLAQVKLEAARLPKPTEAGAPSQAGTATSTQPPAMPPSQSPSASEYSLTASARREIRQLLEQALKREPHNVRALGLLALISEQDGDVAHAEALMTAASRRATRDRLARTWLLQSAFRKKEFAQAVAHADVLLRAHASAMPTVAPFLTAMAETADGQPLVLAALTRNPPWRPSFLKVMLDSVTDARTPLGLLLGLKDTATPATSSDRANYLFFLLNRGFYDLAYYTWLQFLTEEELARADIVYNGSFETTPSGLPFDWLIEAHSGVTIDIVERPDAEGRHALVISLLGGRVDMRGVSQLMAIPPGPHVLTGRFKSEIRGRRGFAWKLTCAADHRLIAETPMAVGVSRTWETFRAEFTVPEDCRAQYLRLTFDARSASEQLASGSIAYDAIRIDRAEASP